MVNERYIGWQGEKLNERQKKVWTKDKTSEWTHYYCVYKTLYDVICVTRSIIVYYNYSHPVYIFVEPMNIIKLNQD